MGHSENLLGTIVIIFICDNRPKTLDKYGTKQYEHCKVKPSQLRRSVMVRKSVSSTTSLYICDNVKDCKYCNKRAMQ